MEETRHRDHRRGRSDEISVLRPAWWEWRRYCVYGDDDARRSFAFSRSLSHSIRAMFWIGGRRSHRTPTEPSTDPTRRPLTVIFFQFRLTVEQPTGVTVIWKDAVVPDRIPVRAVWCVIVGDKLVERSLREAGRMMGIAARMVFRLVLLLHALLGQ